MHTFSIDDFMPPAPEDELIPTFVERVSSDRRRTYRELIEIEPPSPIKRARLSLMNDRDAPNEPIPWQPDDTGERYDMLPDVPLDPPQTKAPRRKRDKYSVRFWSIFILLRC